MLPHSAGHVLVSVALEVMKHLPDTTMNMLAQGKAGQMYPLLGAGGTVILSNSNSEHTSFGGLCQKKQATRDLTGVRGWSRMLLTYYVPIEHCVGINLLGKQHMGVLPLIPKTITHHQVLFRRHGSKTVTTCSEACRGVSPHLDASE